jgi:membrane fusion protein (multidrug efflux system)
VDAAENTLTQRRLAVGRAEEALARARVAVASAQVQITEAAAARDLAQGRVAEAQAAIASLNVTLKKAKLRAPVSGTLEEHLAEPGEVLAPGTPIARIYDLSHVRAVVNVPDRYVPFLDATNPAVKNYIAHAMPGAEQAVKASVVLPGLPKLTGGAYEGLELAAEVDRIAQAADPLSNTFVVELRLPNPQGALKEGMIVNARIAFLRYGAAVTIPIRAVQVSDAGPRVLVVEERDGTTRAFVRDIEPISIQEDTLLVGSGVAPGDRLVIAGGKGVMNGEEVNVVIADGVVAEEYRREPPAPAP